MKNQGSIIEKANPPCCLLNKYGDLVTVGKSLIPLLYEPVLQAMHGARMLLSGLERQGNQDDPKAPMFMQEWSVEVMQEPPAELAESSHRPPS